MTRRLLRVLFLAFAVAVMVTDIDAARRPAHAAGVLICSFTMTAEAFGSIDVLPGAALATNATLTINCYGLSVAQTVLFCVAFPSTSMTGPSSSTLSYSLAGPPPATSPWSSVTPISFLVPTLGGSKTVPIPATVLAGQSNAPPGSYSQAVTATVQFGFTTCTSGFQQVGSFTFSTTASVIKSCNVSAGNLAFGSTGTLTSAIPGQSQISLQCSSGTGYAIGLDGGTSGATDPTQRKMIAGAESVTYGLYRDSAYSLPWGSTPGSNVLSGSGTSLTQSIPVYGLVPVQATPPPGTYTDTIVLSVTY